MSQGGAFPDGAEDDAFAFYEEAIRSGCEYVDVEITWNLRHTFEGHLQPVNGRTHPTQGEYKV